MRAINTVFLIALVFTALSCKPVEPIVDEDYVPTPYAIEVPRGFPDIEEPGFNPTTVEGLDLGRRLYYDNILSTNGRACASCHFQTLAFSSPAEGPGGMSIMPHINLAWSDQFTWAGWDDVLDHVPLGDLAEGNEFLQANNELIKERLTANLDYRQRFAKAFGIDISIVTQEQRQSYIAMALAQFMRTQVSGNSRLDQFVRGEATLTSSEFNGYVIFNTEKGDCFHCHSYPQMTDFDFHNNGIDDDFSGSAAGRYDVTGNTADLGKWKTPTLRNTELTAPYMHDRRFATLEEVVEHYDSGVLHSETVDPIMTKPGKEFGLQLTTQEKADLVAFLKTLTDDDFITNPDLSNPFQ